MIKKIRNAIIAIGTFFIMLPIKVFGSIFSNDLLKSSNNFQTLYGGVVIEPEEIDNEINIWTILKIILIPLILLIGCIIYVCKSKGSEKAKIIVGILLIILAIVFLNVSYNYLLN